MDCNPRRYFACFEVQFLSRRRAGVSLCSALHKTDLITFVEWLPVAGYRVEYRVIVSSRVLLRNYCEELTESICPEGAEW